MNNSNNMKRKSFAALCAAVLAVGCVGVMPVSAEEAKLNSFEPTADNVKIVGRGKYLEDKSALWFGLTNSGVEFTFEGTKVSFDLLGDGNAASADNPARFKLFCDGVIVSDFVLEGKKQTVTFDLDEDFVIDDDYVGHLVTLLKVSEAENGTVRLDNIHTDSDSIKPAPANDKKIEFIGDSITCGYGVDAESAGDHFSTRTEDGTKTYAYKAAKELCMDYSMVSYSGFGIISGYTTDGKRNTTSTLPQYYDKLGFSWWSDFDGGKQISSVDWDFDEFVPDVIVVNLGTNDASYINSVKNADDKQAEREAYTAEYKNFIKQLREKNPDAYILCTLGIMGQDLYDYMAKAVDEYTAETGDINVGALKFDLQDTANDGVGADWHPSEASHEKAADKLVKAIRDKLEKEDNFPEAPFIRDVQFGIHDVDGKAKTAYCVSWDCPESAVKTDGKYERFKVNYRERGDSEYKSITVSTADTFVCWLDDLKPETDYVFSVTGEGTASDGTPFSKESEGVILFTTYKDFKLPDAPVISDESEVTSDSINLKWSKVDGAKSYELYYLPTERIDDDFWTGIIRIADITDTSYKVEGLGANTEYRFTITAKVPTPDGKYTYLTSEDKDITTLEKSKTDISDAVITFRTSNKVKNMGRNIVPAFSVKLDGKTLKKGVDYTVSVKNGKKPGKATLIVKGKGDYKGKLTKSFIVVPAKVKLTGLEKPKDGRLVASWSESSGASGYQMWVCHRSDFERCVKKYIVKDGATLTRLIKGLTVCNRYYVKVRPFVTINGKRFYGAFSNVKNIKV